MVATVAFCVLEYQLRHVAMEKGEHLSPEYLAVNPNHQIPTLLDGDVKIHESNATLRYLCVKHALHDWCPQDPAKRAAIEQWLDWNQCWLSPAVVDIVLNSVFLGERGDAAAVERGRNKLRELEPILESGLAGKSLRVSELRSPICRSLPASFSSASRASTQRVLIPGAGLSGSAHSTASAARCRRVDGPCGIGNCRDGAHTGAG